jgi:hypothetical protein
MRMRDQSIFLYERVWERRIYLSRGQYIRMSLAVLQSLQMLDCDEGL